ncbi:hypothetical protein BpHYR1_024625 [Brachionus plicatilis]|uniref:Uncharacterized protein n=1 Tax=Brachionus plicatilis TaxID=10195 RepID=A0A3M7SQV7_BRAPC|nr:hypothetical protein BpHYR1_024625 [Brachionus plicatilis]
MKFILDLLSRSNIKKEKKDALIRDYLTCTSISIIIWNNELTFVALNEFCILDDTSCTLENLVFILSKLTKP